MPSSAWCVAPTGVSDGARPGGPHTGFNDGLALGDGLAAAAEHILQYCKYNWLLHQVAEKAYWADYFGGANFMVSFNLGGDPLVETIEDAIDTLKRSDIEWMYLPEIQKLVHVPNE